jgi:transcriptional regulator with XRE-family HTH domain
MRIGTAIQQLRKRAGIKQIELARVAGISHTRLCEIERNKSNPKLSTLEEISHALKLPVWCIFFYAEHGKIDDRIQRAITNSVIYLDREYLIKPVFLSTSHQAPDGLL